MISKILALNAMESPKSGAGAFTRDLSVLSIVAVSGVAAWFVFPLDLPFLTRMITTGLLVLSLFLVLGQCGIATLGHAALYGMGAYAAAISCSHGVLNPVVLLFIGLFAGAIAGVLTGVIIVSASGLPQLVLSIALLQLFYELANRLRWLTGGSDGLPITPDPLLGFAWDLQGRTGFVVALLTLLVCLAVVLAVIRSPFGLVCRAIKVDPTRVRSLGIEIRPALLKMYGISGSIAGLAGALSAVTNGIVGLEALSFELSAKVLVMLVLGGVTSVAGALFGTVVFVSFEHLVAIANPFHWFTFLGVLLVVVARFLPNGLISLPSVVMPALRKPERRRRDARAAS
ncbi:branched-chain amino acid ABC transporter permease [Pseudorhodoplanes sp.]|uniref:branched-chain amino acid ABC transporter permease n=1 Tax=Pseudorhodoplanes sp. TaxID=1934341 RepID=UPI003D101884